LGQKPLVVVSGLPGSGKTTLGRRLAQALNLPLIDKDDILDRLFETAREPALHAIVLAVRQALNEELS
jgi:shikimate kinase